MIPPIKCSCGGSYTMSGIVILTFTCDKCGRRWYMTPIEHLA